MPDTSVRYFNSTMTGAPALSGTAGTLIGVLDACLVNGFGSVTLTSLVVASNVATATVSGGHNLAMVGATGPVVRIAGATPSGLNGDWRVASVPSSTTFTFATTGVSDQTASGTMTAKRAPAGFSKAFSGTNKAAYRADDLQSTRLYLRVNDSTTTYASVIGYETMSDVDTGTGAFNSEWYWLKSQTASSAARTWRLVADSRCFYLFNYWHSGYPSSSEGYWFGDFCSRIAAGDPYGCGLIAAVVNTHPYPGGNSAGQTELYRINSPAVGHRVARRHTQTGGAVAFLKGGSATNGDIMGGMNFGFAYPSPINNEFLASMVHIEHESVLRGHMPGLYAPFHYRTPPDNTHVEGDEQTLVVIALGYGTVDYARCALDITGPWRS